MKSENEKHEFHAIDISGIMNGPILCETRRIASSMQSDDRKERPTVRRQRTSRPRKSDEEETA